MSLTLKEKEKIMQSLHEKINYRIKSISQEHPEFEHETMEEARKRAFKKYKIATRVKRFEKEMFKLCKLKDEVESTYCELVAEVIGSTVEEVRKNAESYNRQGISIEKLEQFEERLQEFAARDVQYFADQVMSESAIGREIKMLREQKRFVDDAVMLATSNSKLYPIYERVMQAVGATETPLLAAGLTANGRQDSPQLPSPKK